IAQNSKYKPATRNGKPTTTFYDFILKFNGKSVAAQSEETGEGVDTAAATGAAAPIAAAIRGGKYQEAIGKANTALVSSPGNPTILQLLGEAQFFNKNYADAAATFGKVGTIGKPYQQVAAQAYANAAVTLATTDAATALTYAQKAVATQDNSNSQFALGVAQLGNKQYTQAAATLKAVGDKTTDPKTKAAIDRQLLSAYLGANDTAGANATEAELKQLDPNGGGAGATVAVHYIDLGNAAMNAKNWSEAVKDYDQAAAAGDAKLAVTANTGAAFALLSMEKPDFTKAHEYAIKAVTAGPNDAQANFAAGVATAGIYATGKKASDKQQALDYLNKADQLAKAAGNVTLAQQIENQIKNIPQ
ncbi:MAG TPA: hypothetical protein VFN49_04880, partial [Candidatus Aquilonibacter sp.]|nr:hypothetical protein [Candidatus Aquilonibacter sp.]